MSQSGVLEEMAIAQNRNSHREDDQWIDTLSGCQGPELQEIAYEDLRRYLYVVAYNYLRKRQHNLPRLQMYQNEELVALSQDFVQGFMLKLVREQYALLAKYSGIGRFLSWASQVLLNMISGEFRKVYWSRNLRITRMNRAAEEATEPEIETERLYLRDRLLNCLEQLPEHYKIALLRCIVNGEKADSVAMDLDTSSNAVHILVYRAKAAMRTYLCAEGINADTLELFTK